MRRLIACAICLLLLGSNTYANAYEAENIAKKCNYKASSGRTYSMLYDNRYRTPFETQKANRNWIEIKAQSEINYLYIVWENLPGEWELQYKNGGEWQTATQQGLNGFLHECVKVEGQSHIRIFSENKSKLSIFELKVYGEGDLPKDVQQWQKSPEKIDILVLSAHPDDEYIFMGGLIPTYALQKELMVAYLTYGQPLRRWELLNGIWHCGLKNYPDIGEFTDLHKKSLKLLYKAWDEEKAQKHVVDLIRKYRPEVLVTHDIDGEYGHVAHKAAAVLSFNAVQLAKDPNYISDYEPWELKKLYLHLGNKNTIKLDWLKPLKGFNGKTAMNVASEAYGFHESQHGGRQDYKGRTFFFSVKPGGMFDNALFSLVYSSVGEDINKNDFFENIP